MGSTKLSTNPYKGVRDFYPEDQFIQNYIFQKMRQVAESFGYAEYSSSILEPAELYRGKTSEEIVNEQMYVFTDKGDREVALRPEMTPSAARMLAARRRELPLPLRWYSIPNVFRYERPQRGRLREHWQLNCDLFGVSGIEAEVEIISLAHQIMKAFGAKDSDFEIRINNRGLLVEWLAKRHNITDANAVTLMARTLDQKQKITSTEFENGLENVLGDKKEVEKFKQDLGLEDERFIEMIEGELNHSALIRIKRDLIKAGVRNLVFDRTLARGFDYYTGIIFEVFDKNPENSRSIFGGGRYDNLLDIFGAEKLPAVGFGMGDVTIRDFLETRGLLPKYKGAADLTLAALPETKIEFLNDLARELREKGVKTETDTTLRKAGDIVKAAVRRNVPFILFVGEKEVGSDKFSLKKLQTGEEQVATRAELPKFILNGRAP